ncbi:hypothetical protein TNCV_2866251 [Trichonephila clavipes]|nr:hypothetical protein TNCV_2866251 [Trichonephila clavipes]
MKLGGHQTCLSINRLWHELCDMLRHKTTALDNIIFNSGMKKLVIMALYQSIDCNVVAFIVLEYGLMIPPAHKVHQTVSFLDVTVFRHTLVD